MTAYRRIQRLQDMDNIDALICLHMINRAWVLPALIAREDFGDTTTEVYYNLTTKMIDDDSLTTNGMTLSAWKIATGATDLYVASAIDTCGRGHHLIQNTLSKQPTLILNGVGTVVSINFPTIGKSIVADFEEYSGIPTSEFLVFKPVYQAVNHFFLSYTDTTVTASPDTVNYFIATNSLINFNYRDSLNNASSQYYTNYGTGSKLTLMETILDGVSRFIGYTNGTQRFNTTDPEGFLNKKTRYAFGLNNGNYAGFKGEFMALIIFKNEELSDAKRHIVEETLMNLYGIV